jgi:hypothetical protein
MPHPALLLSPLFSAQHHCPVRTPFVLLYPVTIGLTITHITLVTLMQEGDYSVRRSLNTAITPFVLYVSKLNKQWKVRK